MTKSWRWTTSQFWEKPVRDSWASENSVLTLFVQKVKKCPVPSRFGHVSDRKSLLEFEAEIDANTEMIL